MTSIYDYIKERRIYLKLKQNELADLVNVSSAHINRIEGGLTKPSPGFLVKIANALDLDVINLYVLSLEERDIPEEIMNELRHLNSIRPLLVPGMPLNRFQKIIQNLSSDQVESLLQILDVISDLIIQSSNRNARDSLN